MFSSQLLIIYSAIQFDRYSQICHHLIWYRWQLVQQYRYINPK
jgi:hypothetical protein